MIPSNLRWIRHDLAWYGRSMNMRAIGEDLGMVGLFVLSMGAAAGLLYGVHKGIQHAVAPARD